MGKRSFLFQGISYLVVSLGALIMLYPLLWMISSSFKPDYYIFKELGLWPSRFTLENYINGWKGVAGISFGRYYLNTFLLIVCVVIGTVLTCSMAAYAFARLEFSFRKLFFAVMMSTMMLPHHAVLIPQYTFFYKIGWVNTYLPLIVPKFLAVDAFFVFLIIQFIRGLPRELDQAATVDGCGPIQIYWRIIIPLSAPALATTAIFAFIWTYNDFFSQLIYISEPKMYTVSLGLRTFADATAKSSYGQLFAMSVVSLIPVFIFFVLFQNLLIEGIVTSGIKG